MYGNSIGNTNEDARKNILMLLLILQAITRKNIKRGIIIFRRSATEIAE